MDASFLNSLEHTSGLSGQSCVLTQESSKEPVYNLENLANLIDITDDNFTKAMQQNYQKTFLDNNNIKRRRETIFDLIA